jgi:hypothetical protein
MQCTLAGSPSGGRRSRYSIASSALASVEIAAANTLAYSGLDRVEPFVEKVQLS